MYRKENIVKVKIYSVSRDKGKLEVDLLTKNLNTK